jgi:hypothetical protein
MKTPNCGAGHAARRAVAICLTLAGVACGTADREYHWTGSVRTVDGIELVWNEGPLAPGDLSLERLWETPRRPVKTDDTTWQNPTQVRATTDRIYVLDPPDGHVVAFGWAGTLRGTFGRRGAGPGELERPTDLLLMDGLVGVTDRGVIDWFDSSGTTQGSGAVNTGVMAYRPGVSMPAMLLEVWPLGDDRVLVASPRGWSLGKPGDSLRLIVPPFPLSRLAPEWSVSAGGSCGRVVPGGAGTILRLRCVALVVQVLDSTGAALREFGVVDEVSVATDEQIARAESLIAARTRASGAPSPLATMAARSRVQSLRQSPRYRGIRVTDSIVVAWEQTPLEFGDGPATVHLFTPSGIYLGPVATDDQWIDFDLLGDRIVALAREADTELAYLVAYRLVVPAGVRAAADSAYRNGSNNSERRGPS